MKSGAGVRSYLALGLLLFAASGCSALIYEIVWYQLLQLVIGSTSVSLGILLATFMGGLCLGSLLVPRMRTTANPLRIYAALELGIGACGVLVELGLPYLNRAYILGAESGLPGMLLRGFLAAICMLAPTILMGASLPIMVRWIKANDEGVAWWGYFYAGNIVGAVFGCLLSGFYLLRVYDTGVATYVAAALNLAVAVCSLVVAGVWTPPVPVPEEERQLPLPGIAAESSALLQSALPDANTFAPRWPVYLAIGLSGATALGAEVVWTRLLGILLLGTVYVFALILAVFLTGLAIGSGVGSWVSKGINARKALGWSQMLLTLGIAWTAFAIIHRLPYWKDDVLTTSNGWRMYLLDLKRCLWSILPATFFWGASFPLACAALEDPGEESGRVSGGIYAANTLGGIVGALAVSLILIPWIGSQQTQRLLMAVCALSGLLLLAPLLRHSVVGIGGLIASLAGVALLAMTVAPVPGAFIAYGRNMASGEKYSKTLFVAEGRNSSVAITQWDGGAIYINVNGHVEATTEIFDMKLQRMVGNLPALLHPDPKSVLGVGFGAGVSAGTFTRYPSVQKITICEIEPRIPPISTRFFAKENYQVALDTRTHIVYDDARHYLMTTREKFDIIASDPLDVFIKGTAALYSEEYFEAVKNHLNPDGMFTLYVPLYETDEPTIKSELATFFKAFPNGTIWANTRDGQGYDMVFMGQVNPLKINLSDLVQKMNRADYAPVRQSLRDININSMFDLFSTYAGNAADLEPWIHGAQINRDKDLRLSYLAGWGINATSADVFYRQMIDYRRPPVQIFTGTPQDLQGLFTAMESASAGNDDSEQ